MIDDMSSVDDSDSEDDDGDVTNDKTGEYDAMIDEICYHYEDVVHNRQAEQQAGWAIRGTTAGSGFSTTELRVLMQDVAVDAQVRWRLPCGGPAVGGR